jgi:hypothetical protein
VKLRDGGMTPQEVRTEPLSLDELRGSAPEMTESLRSTGHNSVDVTYGFGCNLPVDELWRPARIDSMQLATFIERSVEEGVFEFGAGDLHIEDPQGTLEFRLCHESDIHFGSDDPKLVELVINLWKQNGRVLYVSPGPRKSAAQKEWERI